MGKLQPVHSSIRPKIRRPRRMTPVAIQRDHCEALTTVALDIFTDCINVGMPMQDAIFAVYLSGLDHALAAHEEKG